MAHHSNFDVLSDSDSSAPFNRTFLKLSFILVSRNAGPALAMSVGTEKIKLVLRNWFS